MSEERKDLEDEVLAAEEEVMQARQELDLAEDRLSKLEEQLAALPPKEGDAELFYARRDPRQIGLPLEGPKRTARKART